MLARNGLDEYLLSRSGQPVLITNEQSVAVAGKINRVSSLRSKHGSTLKRNVSGRNTAVFVSAKDIHSGGGRIHLPDRVAATGPTKELATLRQWRRVRPFCDLVRVKGPHLAFGIDNVQVRLEPTDRREDSTRRCQAEGSRPTCDKIDLNRIGL